MAAAREGADIDTWRRAFSAALKDLGHIVVVAHHVGELVGYGKATWLDPGARDARGMPAGWYLTGVIVAPNHRRRGVAGQLTSARLDAAVARGAQEVWCFASAVNRASILLHEQLGFVEVTRDFALPGLEFSGGEGILMRWQS
ncbi:ribosomal protein S18 acetylase RimI-like enzyme [Kineosphaera limosa]|uniref:Putative acetyltransferase n=1 Tax=Kineosphaera limosa NBRC 100340 TaxID=1184609 RepID=K6WVV8_9MICO|nr:ribosomal protein S18 acetylase RimI-like enzyme [Kineosphaera limosa]GAB96227.1 putative acetyltransferase [Kineosphaera limosa NBRC 100340]